MSTKDNPSLFDCHAKALPDEPLFTLLARDPTAPWLILEWARQREYDIKIGKRPRSDSAKVDEARDCAAAMTAWRAEHDGAWRDPGSPRL